jgi:hypothetical protein
MGNLSRRDKTLRFLNDPETFETILDTVSNGGSLLSLCDAEGIRYSDVFLWIQANPDRLKAFKDCQISKIEFMTDKILREVARIAFLDIRNAFDDQGNLKPIKELPDDVAAAIEAFEEVVHKDGRKGKRVKFASKTKMLELLGKQFQMFKESVEVHGNVTIEDLINESFKIPSQIPETNRN